MQVYKHEQEKNKKTRKLLGIKQRGNDFFFNLK